MEDGRTRAPRSGYRDRPPLPRTRRASQPPAVDQSQFPQHRAVMQPPLPAFYASLQPSLHHPPPSFINPTVIAQEHYQHQQHFRYFDPIRQQQFVPLTFPAPRQDTHNQTSLISGSLHPQTQHYIQYGTISPAYSVAASRASTPALIPAYAPLTEPLFASFTAHSSQVNLESVFLPSNSTPREQEQPAHSTLASTFVEESPEHPQQSVSAVLPSPTSGQAQPIRYHTAPSLHSSRPQLVTRVSANVVASKRSFRSAEDGVSSTSTDSRVAAQIRPLSAPATFPEFPSATTTPLDDDAVHASLSPAVPVTSSTVADPPGSGPSRRVVRRYKQTPWVMWVGNIPQDATERELYNFFSQGQPNSTEPPSEAIPETPNRQIYLSQARLGRRIGQGSANSSNISSIFLMAKSNCAFVNYNTQEALLEAVRQFHGTKFRPQMRARLVCRVRTSEAPVGSGPTEGDSRSPELLSSISTNIPIMPTPSESDALLALVDDTRTRRFFVLKSITHVDLQLSVQHGFWATRVHNEASLDHAFKTVQDVYLIFGVNKSGEFFGYGRMSTAIFKPDGTQLLDPLVKWPPTDRRPPLVHSSSSGESISHLAPSSSGTLAGSSGSSKVATTSSDGGASLYGTPFAVTWICTQPLPFTNIRHLKNPWNNGHEVKASRDGTELPPVLGQELLREWNRSLTG